MASLAIMTTTSRTRSTSLVIALALAATGCAAQGRYIAYDDSRSIEPASRVVTFVDFFDSGREAVDAFLRDLPEAERSEIEVMLARASDACARLTIITSRSGMNYSQTGASAVLVRSNAEQRIRVATAGHSFYGTSSTEIRLMLSDGRQLSPKKLDSSFDPFASSNGDWALLEIDDAPKHLTAIPVSAPVQGELAFLLAYPSGMGVNAEGDTVYGSAYAQAPLAPIVTIAMVSDTSPLTLTPLAGTLPVGGASGGPIVNRSGALIGVLSGTAWSPDRKGADYWISGATAASFAEHLASLPD